MWKTFLISLILSVSFVKAQTNWTRDVYVPNICVCATSKYCEIASTGSMSDGSGVIDYSMSFNYDDDVISGSITEDCKPVSTGLPIATKTQSKCSTGLEKCCPSIGYSCGLHYPPVAKAPKGNSSAGAADYGAYPWQALITFMDGTYIGSGVLIDQKHVLTIAHKIHKLPRNTLLQVRLGAYNRTNSAKDPLPTMSFNATFIIHPDFTVQTLKNDIAILTLTSNVPLGKYPTISNICLPNTTVTGIRCFVSGWDDAVDHSTRNVLTEIDVPLVDHKTCQTQLRKAWNDADPIYLRDIPKNCDEKMKRHEKKACARKHGKFNEKDCSCVRRQKSNGKKDNQQYKLDKNQFLCAGGEEGKDACLGDGGAPLSCHIYDRFYLFGLVSWSIDCGTDQIPAVFVKIESFIPWIQKTIQNETLSTTKAPRSTTIIIATKPTTTVKTTKKATTTTKKTATTTKKTATTTKKTATTTKAAGKTTKKATTVKTTKLATTSTTTKPKTSTKAATLASTIQAAIFSTIKPLTTTTMKLNLTTSTTSKSNLTNTTNSAALKTNATTTTKVSATQTTPQIPAKLVTASIASTTPPPQEIFCDFTKPFYDTNGNYLNTACLILKSSSYADSDAYCKKNGMSLININSTIKKSALTIFIEEIYGYSGDIWWTNGTTGKNCSGFSGNSSFAITKQVDCASTFYFVCEYNNVNLPRIANSFALNAEACGFYQNVYSKSTAYVKTICFIGYYRSYAISDYVCKINGMKLFNVDSANSLSQLSDAVESYYSTSSGYDFWVNGSFANKTCARLNSTYSPCIVDNDNCNSFFWSFCEFSDVSYDDTITSTTMKM